LEFLAIFVLWIKRYCLDKNDVMRKVTNAKPADYIRHTPKDEEIKQQGIVDVQMITLIFMHGRKTQIERLNIQLD